jgi:sugar lactone lactonase YvrE
MGASLRVFVSNLKYIRRGAQRSSRIKLLVWFIFALAGTATAWAQVTFTGSQVALAAGTWSAPAGAATDGKGNVFIADRGNNRVVELSPNGTGFNAPIIVLSGLSSPAGIAADWNGNLFVSDTGNDRILKLPLALGGFDAPVTVASGFNAPVGIAVDSADNLYVADSGNNRVVELSLIGAGYGAPVSVSSGLSNPMGVAIDASRNLFIADTGNQRIVKQLYTAGGYPAQQSIWNGTMTPVNISVDKSDDLYIVDALNERVYEITWFAAANRFQSQLVIGTGLVSPAGVMPDATGNVYITDSSTNQVIQFVAAGLNFNVAAIGSPAAEVTYNFSIAAGTSLGSVGIYTQGVSGRDFVDAGASTCLAQTYTATTYCGVNVEFSPLGSGTRSGAVELFDQNGNSLATAFISGVGSGPQAAVFPGTVTSLGSQLSAPAGVAVDGFGNVYIADTGNNRIVALPWTGSGYDAQITLLQSGLITPMGLAVDAAGNLYIASSGNDKIVKLPRSVSGFGQPIKVGTSFSGPAGVTIDSKGYLYVADTLDARVDQFTWIGAAYSTELEVGSNHKAPTGIAVDGGGNVYYTDPYQNQISEVICCATRYASQLDMNSVQTSFPSAIAVDGNSNLYVLDTNNNRVLLLPWSGTAYGKQITIASGFNSPSGIAMSANGHLFVADTGNNQVVEIDLSTPAQMSFANAYLGSTSPDGQHVAQIQNIGNQPLEFSSISYPPDFIESAGVGNPCLEGGQVSQGQSCQVGVSFTPQEIGSPLREIVEITGNSLGATNSRLTIPATGTSSGKLPQTISFAPLPSVTYGIAPFALSAAASSALPVTYTVVSGPAVLQNGGKVLRVNGAGAVIIEAAQPGNSTYWAANTITITLTVTPAMLTVTPWTVAAVYGAIPSHFSYSISGFVNGDNPTTAMTGTPVITSIATGASAAGTYPIVASQGTLTAVNYKFAFAPAALTVAKARLTIVVNSIIRIYGSPMTAPTWYLLGFVNGDTASVVTGAPVLTALANSGSPVGTYPIVGSTGTLVAKNYIFTANSSLVTVKPALITVTPASQSITYGAPIPKLTYSFSGLMNGDSTGVVQGHPILSTAAVQKSGAGNYAISTSLGTLTAANYTFRLSSGVLTINKAPLLVTLASASMTYGGKLPAFSYTLIGFLSGDTAATAVSGAPAFITSANSTTKPGTYSISSAAGTLTSSNYRFSFGATTLSIGKSILTITANPVSKTYGAALPALTYKLTGFLNGDGTATVHGAVALTTKATAASPAGTYPVACNSGAMTSDVYTLNCVNSTLTVNKAPLTVKGSYLGMTYGGAVPVLTYQLNGFVNGETAASVPGVPALSSVVTSSTSVGVYPVSVAVGSLTAANYTISPSNGSITVQKALLKVVAAPQTSTYGAALPTLTYTLSGFLNGESQKIATSGNPQLSVPATSTSPVGNYMITPALGSLAASNYNFVFVPAWLTVTKAPLTVSANNLTMQVGTALPALTYSIAGWVNGDTQVTALSGTPALTTNATSKSAAGSYPIIVAPGTMKGANYQLVYVNGILIASQSTATLHRALPN